MNPQTTIFIGIQSSGKGTQLRLLKEVLTKADEDVLTHVSGKALRSFLAEDKPGTRKAKETLDQGGLMPVFLPIALWGRTFLEKLTPQTHLLIDGSPRQLIESQALEQALEFYGRVPFDVIYLTLTEEVVFERIKKRGRKDDTEEGIQRRLDGHRTHIELILDRLRESELARVHEIDGSQSIEAVHEDVLRSLGMKGK